jgi:hypothetical protein
MSIGLGDVPDLGIPSGASETERNTAIDAYLTEIVPRYGPDEATGCSSATSSASTTAQSVPTSTEYKPNYASAVKNALVNHRFCSARCRAVVPGVEHSINLKSTRAAWVADPPRCLGRRRGSSQARTSTYPGSESAVPTYFGAYDSARPLATKRGVSS